VTVTQSDGYIPGFGLKPFLWLFCRARDENFSKLIVRSTLMRNYYLTSVICLIVWFLSYTLVSAQTENKEDKAPNFSIRDIQGKRIELTELLKQGPVLIDFWALWCIPCRKELPHLQTLYNRYKGEGLIVLTINEDDPSSESKVKPFIKGSRYKFIAVVDKDKELWRNFKVVSLPTLFLIDQQGNIQKTYVGYRPGDEKELEKDIRELLLIKNTK
jgi:peroxiredoxin